MANDFKNQGAALTTGGAIVYSAPTGSGESAIIHSMICLLYTSDAADE